MGRAHKSYDGVERDFKRRFSLTRYTPTKIDYISSMPDEVLVCILSLLTLEEAAVTSVLSSRWRNLWTFIPMQSFVVADTRTNRCFKSLMKHLTLGTGKLYSALVFHCFESLISLSFKYIGLTSKVIDNILSHCPRLEHLHITTSSRLVSVKVAGTHLQLKHLEVYECNELRKMDIHAPNLVSLRYEGPHIELSLECGHQLVDVFCHIYAGTCKFRVSFLVWQFKPYLSLLKTFTLACNPAEVELSSKMLPTFSNLTELVVFLETENESLLPYTLFLKMSPSLHKLELHFIWRKPRNIRKLLRKMEGTNWEHVSEYEPHHLLKEVVLSGFRGRPEDMELSMYLLHNAVSLEKFTIDPYFRMLFGNSWSRTKEKGITAARKCAELLFGKKPPQVEMSIL